jgi:AraC-like DNA-binding protein
MNTLLYISSSLAFLLALYLLTGNALPKSPRRLLAAALLTVAALNLLAVLKIVDPGNPFVVVRPVLAIALPAILFLHIATAMRQEQRMYARDAVHIAGPAAVVVLYAISGSARFVDPLIALTTVLYLVLIAWHSRGGASSFAVFGPRLSILFSRWSRMVIAFLAVAVILDATIMFEVNSAGGSLGQSPVLSLSVILLLGGFSYLLVSGLHQAGPLSWAGMSTRQTKAEHLQLIERLEDAMLSSRAFLDPNLTLQRLARKTGASIPDVSAAINDHRQRNYNQWLNGFRIEEAKRILRESPDRKITEIMFAAGFQNKSTFNAAFRAAVGESPSSWRNRIRDVEKHSI